MKAVFAILAYFAVQPSFLTAKYAKNLLFLVVPIRRYVGCHRLPGSGDIDIFPLIGNNGGTVRCNTDFFHDRT